MGEPRKALRINLKRHFDKRGRYAYI